MGCGADLYLLADQSIIHGFFEAGHLLVQLFNRHALALLLQQRSDPIDLFQHRAVLSIRLYRAGERLDPMRHS